METKGKPRQSFSSSTTKLLRTKYQVLRSQKKIPDPARFDICRPAEAMGELQDPHQEQGLAQPTPEPEG